MTFFALNATVAYVPVAFFVTITTTAIMNIGNRNCAAGRCFDVKSLI
jgi:hypothetical protein